ncbi:MAG TPA: hypothetical protein VGM87_13330 [Roseomonas sp.]
MASDRKRPPAVFALAVIGLVALAVAASPCAWDTYSEAAVPAGALAAAAQTSP